MIGASWGVTQTEIERDYPCDHYAPVNTIELWRGITVNAPPAVVWRRLRQLQLAPYSYDWLDNLGHRSPRQLRTLPDHKPGERFSCVAGRFKVGRVLGVLPGEHLTVRIMGATMSYVLTPEDSSTRLLLKILLDRAHRYAIPLAIGDLPMARRQLKNLKRLAEADHINSAR
ncbi:SRPBCC family protein [Arthrobacter sp. ISL-85]|uniref:SRPBCC family protein n=1 Tax=Arthrobacter sp. ISL-85 TaxID=2819115 RepID=UPI001BE8580F|nr:SRPBCC family protein [Arthrobacter sp. ISL-85]MBT2566255.1 SRPBCC family protein [Arthrobacter sp. ISL-85]